MRSSLFKPVAVSLAALALGFSLATTPASAAFRTGGGGGFHGGGFHGGFGGGYRGFGGAYRGFGGWGYGGWGWGGYGYYGDPYDAYYGYGPYYGAPYPYAGDAGCVRPQRVYDRHGHYLGRRYVDMCQ